jgi:putative membrane protein
VSEETLIKKAEFTQKVCSYWLVQGALVLVLTLAGIPLLLLWIPLGLLLTRHYLSRMECLLTNKALKVKKGMLVRVEKTIPLEKITDMGLVQGPLMRFFGLYKLSVETAGQSGPGALVSLTGIIDTKAFRAMVLQQREEMLVKSESSNTDVASNDSADQLTLLSEIRDTLQRIEQQMKQKS